MKTEVDKNVCNILIYYKTTTPEMPTCLHNKPIEEVLWVLVRQASMWKQLSRVQSSVRFP
jgi:hypothetical protein